MLQLALSFQDRACLASEGCETKKLPETDQTDYGRAKAAMNSMFKVNGDIGVSWSVTSPLDAEDSVHRGVGSGLAEIA